MTTFMRIYDTGMDLSIVNQMFITNNIGVYESKGSVMKALRITLKRLREVLGFA